MRLYGKFDKTQKMKKNLSILFLFLFSITFIGSAKNKPIKVACVGNSITYGYTVENREVNSYPSQLQRMLGDGYEVGNFGKSGATLLNKGHRPYMQQEEYKQALAFAGDIVVIHLGINDTDPRNWPNYRDFFVGDYLELIDSFRKVNPKARFLVARMTTISDRHPRFESGTRDWHEEIQRAIETVAKVSGAQLIDFFEPLYPYPYILHDAVHPNAEGAGILAKTVYSSITGNFGGLQMPMIFSDNMVLQRERPLPISGTANAGEKITVTIGKQKHTAVTADNGKWSVVLQPLKTGETYTLRVSSPKKTLTYKNVAAGEVWLCSGQSNMEFRLRQSATAKTDIPQANNPRIRLFDMKPRWFTNDVTWSQSALDSINHLHYFTQPKWQSATPETAAQFSAVAYYFGRMLQDSLNVPIGLINNAVGGSTTGSWVNRWALEYHFPAIFRNWKENDFIQEWARGRAKKNLGENADKLQRHPYEPSYLFDAGIRPLEKFPIRGAIWYQGESNAHNKEAHAKLFKLLIDSWRQNWNNAQMPFYFVQLSSIDRPSWTWFRDSQRRLQQEISHTGMAVSSDVGDSLDVHPTRKKEIGLRLARLALNETYGMKNVVPNGPLFRSAEFRNGAAYVSFDNADGLRSSDGKPIITFEVAEIPGLFYPAVATVEGNRIKASSPEVKNPKYVRYGWQPFTRANLVNAEGLPASTFTNEP